MRAMHFVIVLAAAISIAEPGVAQIPPNVLFPGSAYPSVARETNVWCAIEPGSVSFQRSGTGPAKITLPEVTWVSYSNTPAVSYRLSGLLILSFTYAASGTTAFIVAGGAPNSIARAPFTNYVQSYDSTSHTLSVVFNVRFPLCTLPVRLILRN